MLRKENPGLENSLFLSDKRKDGFENSPLLVPKKFRLREKFAKEGLENSPFLIFGNTDLEISLFNEGIENSFLLDDIRKEGLLNSREYFLTLNDSLVNSPFLTLKKLILAKAGLVKKESKKITKKMVRRFLTYSIPF